MGEYKEIEGQIARIENAYAALSGTGIARVKIGTSSDPKSRAPRSEKDERDGKFWASIGEQTEYRPTIAGALLALENHLADRIDDQISGLKRLQDIRATLKLPEITIGRGGE